MLTLISISLIGEIRTNGTFLPMLAHFSVNIVVDAVTYSFFFVRLHCD